jgi:hypothetical protein
MICSYRDPKFNLNYPSGSFTEMASHEFREGGLMFINSHFQEYERIRLPEEEVVEPFQPGEAKRLLKNSVAVYIWKDNSRRLCLAPLRLNKNDPLVSRDLGRENHRCLPENVTEADFWRIFDEVLAVAE